MPRHTPIRRPGQWSRLWRLALLGIASAWLLPATAHAHEQRDVGDGQYSVEVGFLNEPAYLAQPNALFLKVQQYGADGGPVEGLAAGLQAEVQKDGVTRALALVPQTEAGVYHAAFIPTALGDYTFRLFGDIDGTSIDESFRSSPNTFAPVEPVSSAQVPVPVPVGDELNQDLAQVRADAAQARTIAVVGAALGAIGLMATLAAFLRRRPAASSVTAPPLTTHEEDTGLIRRRT